MDRGAISIELNVFIAKRIKQLRKQQKITQDELSECADLQQKYINKIENGKIGNITVVTLEKIIHALGMEYTDFFDFSNLENLEENTNIDIGKLNLNSLDEDEAKKMLGELIEYSNKFESSFKQFKNNIDKKNTH